MNYERGLVAWMLHRRGADELDQIRTDSLTDDRLAAIVEATRELSMRDVWPTPGEIVELAGARCSGATAEFFDAVQSEPAVLKFTFDQLLDRVSTAAAKRRLEVRLRAAAQRLHSDGVREISIDLADELLREADRQESSAEQSFFEAGSEELARTLDPSLEGGLPTGLPEVDKRIRGLVPGTLTVIGGRPGDGKTSLILQGISAAIDTSKRVLFFSLEMTHGLFALSLAAQRVGASLFKLRTQPDAATLLEDELRRLDGTVLVEDPSFISIEEIERVARMNHRRFGVDIVYVDYLQLVETEREIDTRHLEVGYVSRRMRALAKDLRVPVVTAAQVRRPSATGDPKPKLSDLRESGAIEQDADTVLLIHNPRSAEVSAGVFSADIVVAKNRRGPIGDVPVNWDGPRTRFLPRVEAGVWK